MSERTIEIRWPDSDLCANKRMRVRSQGALAKMSTLKRNYGFAATALWLAAGVPVKPFQRAVLTVCYVPPDNRPRDRDNLGTALKPVLDAAVKCGILADDSMKVITCEHHYVLSSNPTNPCVRLTLQESLK